MSFSTIRRRIAVCSAIAMVSVAGASAAGAQTTSGSGGWGAEGRIGAGNAVYLARWFNDDWSLLAGGSLSASSNTTEGNSDELKSSAANVTALLRRSWGGTMVRPFVAVGPTYMRASNKRLSVFNDVSRTEKSTTNALGARGDIGAMVPVSSKVYLGVSSGISFTRATSESPSSPTTTFKSHSNQVAAGNLQFIIGFRF